MIVLTNESNEPITVVHLMKGGVAKSTVLAPNESWKFPIGQKKEVIVHLTIWADKGYMGYIKMP